MVRRFLLPFAAAVFLASCSVLIDVDGKQCESDADCQALSSGAVCERSLCVEPSTGEAGATGSGGSPQIDPLMCEVRSTSEEPRVKYSFAPIFANPPKAPQPFTIKACGQLDLECNSPIFGPLEVSAGAPEAFEVPPGFTGYFEITNPDTLSALLFLGRPVVEDTVGWNVTVPDETTVLQLGLATGEQVDPELGIVVSVARDCASGPLEGVTYTSSAGGLGFYFVTNLPNTELTETGPQGAAGFVNVPIGTAILSGVHNPSGTALGPSSLRLKPGWLSLVEIFP